MEIIDRRLNPSGKSRPQVKRFFDRLNDATQKALIKQGIEKTRIVGGNSETLVIEVPATAIHEPTFHTHFKTGKRQIVLAGNKEFSKGDRLQRQQGQGSGGGGGGGETIKVPISRQDFLKLLFADMCLPNLEEVTGSSQEMDVRIAGHAREGAPHRLDIGRSTIQAMGRRFAMGRPDIEKFKAAQEVLKSLEESGTPEEQDRQRKLVEAMGERRKVIPWMIEKDLRYRRLEHTPKPTMQAVMFHIMDVSASMDVARKLVAKAFFISTGLFLERNHPNGVTHVFIRHAEKAERCSEAEFFGDGLTGGTKASTAFDLAKDIAQEFPRDRFNRYFAYAGDGDNSDAPPIIEKAISALIDPAQEGFRYGAYLEVLSDSHIPTKLGRSFGVIANQFPNRLSIQRADSREKVHPALRRMFGIKEKGLRAALGASAFTHGAAWAEP